MDHPRGCGEHHPVRTQSGMDAGSSPRMRGTLERLPPLTFLIGIIPADAGNTAAWAVTLSCSPDHPRGCGEHVRLGGLTPATGGSSPRMRGTQTGKTTAADTGRIIPADAGNTKWSMCNPWKRRDHPRGCGEHPGRVEGGVADQGSSPRMRGTL